MKKHTALIALFTAISATGMTKLVTKNERPELMQVAVGMLAFIAIWIAVFLIVNRKK